MSDTTNPEVAAFLADHPIPDGVREDCPELVTKLEAQLTEVSGKLAAGTVTREEADEEIADLLEQDIMEELIGSLTENEAGGKFARLAA